MRTYNIPIYAGDGIGIDVTAEAVKTMKAVAKKFGFGLNLVEFPWGHRYWKETGKVVPDDFLKILSDYPVIFLGAVGDPANVPDHITLRPLIEMRQKFDQYACIRPAKLFPGVSSPLANRKPGDIDIVVIRENSEGEYVDAGGFFKIETTDGVALQSAIHTRKGVERIIRFGFEIAMKRPRKHLTLVTKSNALKFSMVFWDKVFDSVRQDYPDVHINKYHVDAMCMALVQKPQLFDVVVCSNMFGDIISDLTGAIAGSIGLAPSSNLNPERLYPSLFEPVHGSAPDIAGKGIANPLAAIRSAAMMLDFLGEAQAAAMIEKVVESCVMESRVLTPDLGGRASTGEVGTEIERKILEFNN
ncbi:MAG TPA: 3-isopropylmalate dehydrogenase [Chitinispirillaceae bacterium]|nr:3-isopropylmalate dehydrogenase [Chitinispirillaceae bacterium]